MEANKTFIKHLVSQGTRNDALCAAIEIAYNHGVKDAMLTSNYEVNRPTLSKLRNKIPISRNKEVYFEAITITLNNLRLKAKSKGEKDEETDLRKALADIALLRCGIATDEEMMEIDRSRAKREYLASIL